MKTNYGKTKTKNQKTSAIEIYLPPFCIYAHAKQRFQNSNRTVHIFGYSNMWEIPDVIEEEFKKTHLNSFLIDSKL